MINLNTRNITLPQSITFTGNSQEIRKRYSERLKDKQFSETNILNLEGLVKRFKNEGMNYNTALKIAKKNPFILVQKPETLEFNIRESAKRFKDFGITLEDYLNCAIKNCILFSSSPDTVEKNIKGTVKTFENYGLTTEKYLKCAMSNPALFSSSPKTIKKKIFNIANILDVPTSDILTMHLKQPSVFTCKVKEITKKYEILKYIEENKIFDGNIPKPTQQELNQSILRKKFTNANETYFLELLRNKICNNLKKGQKLPYLNLENNLKNIIIKN